MKIMKICCLASVLVAMPARAVEVPKEEWVSHMRSIIPTLFCGSEQYFRQCFDVTVEQCEETMESAARACINNLEAQIPEILVQPQDGNRWGNVIGQCVGASYEQVHKAQHTREAACLDPSNWQK